MRVKSECGVGDAGTMQLQEDGDGREEYMLLDSQAYI